MKTLNPDSAVVAAYLFELRYRRWLNSEHARQSFNAKSEVEKEKVSDGRRLLNALDYCHIERW